jgi:hypothetical protein
VEATAPVTVDVAVEPNDPGLAELSSAPLPPEPLPDAVEEEPVEAFDVPAVLLDTTALGVAAAREPEVEVW